MKKIYLMFLAALCMLGTKAQAPANDVCSGAIVIPPAGPFPFTTGATSNVNATLTADPTNTCQTNINRGVWYTFTPSVSGSFVISSCQSDAPLSTITDNVISVFTSSGGCAGTFTQLVCDDDGCTTLNFQAITTAPMVAGTQYFILVYGYNTNTGNVQLKITAPPVCTVTTVPYTMPIETVTTPLLPDCTTGQNVNADASTWATYTEDDIPLPGYTYPVLGYAYNSTNAGNDWIFTRGLTLTAGTSYTLTFKYGNDQTLPADAPDYYFEKMKVMYGTAATAAGMTLPLADYPSIASATPLNGNIQFTPTATGTYYIGFQAYSDANQDVLLLDDVSIIATPACPQPTGLTAGSVTATSASISFGPATTGSYILEYGAPGFTPGTGLTAGTGGTIVNGTVSPISMSPLTTGTTYDVYVRQNCTATSAGFSPNSNKLTFSTTLNCAAATVITCGVTQTASITAGAGIYSPGTCGFTTPGKELLYTFTAPTAGDYDFEITAINTAGYIDYLFRDGATGCGPTGWTCISDVNSTGVLGTFTFTAGQTITLLLDAETTTDAPSHSFRIVCAPTPPANDDAFGAVNLTVGAGCTAAPYTNFAATHSATEPSASCAATTTDATHTVWFKFTATSTAVKVSTDLGTGDLDDTQVGLFSAGDAFNYATFNIISCDDDNGAVGGLKSIIYATGLTVGQVYYIEVDGYDGNTGTFCVAVDDLNSSMLAATPTCAGSVQTPGGAVTTYAGQVPLVDASGNLIAIVRNPAGGAVSSYTVGQNKNTGAVRQDGNGHFYLDRNYLISNSTATNVQVQFFFTNAELAALTAADPTITLGTLGAFKQTGTTCNNDFTGTAGTGSTLLQTASGSQGGLSWIQVTTPSFSNFYLNKAATVLPIKLEYFTGTKQAAGNVLDWKVNSTDPSISITLERSGDNRGFTGIYNIAASATRCLQPFDHTDAQPLAGVNYYRLKIVEVSGKVTYSPIVVLFGNTKGFELIAVQPNPVVGTAMLNITSSGSAKMEIRITDIAGKTISNQTVNVLAGANKVPMNFSKLAAGTYHITGKTADGEIKTIRFVKQ